MIIVRPSSWSQKWDPSDRGDVYEVTADSIYCGSHSVRRSTIPPAQFLGPQNSVAVSHHSQHPMPPMLHVAAGGLQPPAVAAFMSTACATTLPENTMGHQLTEQEFSTSSARAALATAAPERVWLSRASLRTRPAAGPSRMQ